MSVEAISWALNSDVKHSSAKFVLVVLANCASAETMEAYPSISLLSDATSQDRKTVIANLKRLIDSGHIFNTGKRKGSTGQVIIYRLNSTKNGTVKEYQERDCTESQTVPFFPDNSTVFPSKEYRFPPETVPKTGHGTVRTVSEPSVNKKHTADAELFPDVSVQVVADFKALRKSHKAPITKTAIAGIKREADGAGISLESALTHCIERNWRGFKADWLKTQPARAGPGYQSIHEKRADTIAYLTGRKPIPSAEKDITGESHRVTG